MRATHHGQELLCSIKGRIHLRRLSLALTFLLQSCGGPYIIVHVAFVGSVLATIRPELRNNERTILLQRLRVRPVYR